MAQISSSRWANVNLDRQTEHEAAIATVKFLEKVRDTLSEGDFSTNKTLLTMRWVSEKWTSRNNLGDNYVLGGVHYETSASTVHCRVQKERC